MLKSTEGAERASALSRDNPFPGLRPYDEEDARWFFGRAGEVNELLKRLRRLHFLAIVGASGSGKSSLVRAGVLPHIRDGYLDAEWHIATFRPGDRPVANLAEALSTAIPGTDPSALESALHTSAQGLVRGLQACRLQRESKVLVLVDQFEEIFQFAQRRGESAQEEVKEFLKLLLAAAVSDEVAVYVVITMRVEWLNECASYAGLAEAINAGIYLVPQMGRQQLQRAIFGPLEAAEGSITSSLLDRMLNDLDTRSDQLPVLQHALMRIWDRCGRTAPFDAAAYQAVGTFSNCLSAHAEEVYAELNQHHQQVAGQLFRSITQVNKNRKIRRPRPLGEIASATGASVAELSAVVMAFSAPGRSFLVTTPGALNDDSVIDLSHEALIRQWKRLDGWVDSEAEIQSRLQRLEQDAIDWDRDRKGLRSCLYRDVQLKRAEELRPRLRHSSLPAEFLRASVRAHARRRFSVIAVAVALVLAAVALPVYQLRERAQRNATQLALAREREKNFEEEAKFNALQAQKAQEFQADIEKQIKDAKGSATALAAIAQSIEAQRVYVQFTPAEASAAKAVQARLQQHGYAVPALQLVNPEKAPAQSQVRYFRDDDRAAATRLAGLVRVPGITVQAYPNAKGVVPAGQFEVWLSELPPVIAHAPVPGPGLPPANNAPSPHAPPAPGPTLSASVSADQVQLGDGTTLTWQSENATEVSIEGIGVVQPSGSMVVTPRQSSTAYRITAKGAGGTVEKTIAVAVTVPAPPPRVTTAPAAVASAAPGPSAVKAALDRYKDAYESESLDDVKRAWPSVSKSQQKAIKTVFDQFNAIHLSLSCRDEDIHVDGNTANAVCQQTAIYTQRGKKVPEQRTTTDFRLVKQGDSWVIGSVE